MKGWCAYTNLNQECEKWVGVNTTHFEECRDKWDGNDWTPDTEGSETGICESNFDFDAWAEEYEGE